MMFYVPLYGAYPYYLHATHCSWPWSPLWHEPEILVEFVSIQCHNPFRCSFLAFLLPLSSSEQSMLCCTSHVWMTPIRLLFAPKPSELISRIHPCIFRLATRKGANYCLPLVLCPFYCVLGVQQRCTSDKLPRAGKIELEHWRPVGRPQFANKVSNKSTQ